jgi:hypothetical protein
MQGSDYHTAYVGKWHLVKTVQPSADFTNGSTTSMVYTESSPKTGVQPDKPDGRFSEFAISNLPIELSRPKFLERHACDFIEKHQRDPFILVVGFVEPHSPYNGPLNDEHPLDEVELDATATLPDSENIPLRYRLMREWQQAEALLDRERLPFQLFFGSRLTNIGASNNAISLVTLVDRSIGAILACGNDVASPTIHRHSHSDHDSLGAYLSAKKQYRRSRAFLADSASWPERGRVVSQPVGHIDFVPTLLDLLQPARSVRRQVCCR